MDLEAKKSSLPFMSAQARLYNRFKITMTDDEFIEAAYPIWRSIGNIARDTQVFQATVPEDGIIKMPPNCEFVSQVTAAELTNVREHKNHNAQGVFFEKEYNKSTMGPAGDARTGAGYTFGESINFTSGNGNIKITSPSLGGLNVEIKYSGILVDSDGLPMLNDLELEAIAVMLAYRAGEMRLFNGEPGAADFIKHIKPEADRLMQAASLDEQITEAGLDKLMDIKASWDRKTYGNRFNFKI